MEAEVGTNQQNKQNIDSKLARFSCKICLEVADQPIITPCGHLYCWKCIYQWAKVKSSCPFCNNKINIDKLTTIYTEEEDATNSNTHKSTASNTGTNQSQSSFSQQEEPEINSQEQSQQQQNHEQNSNDQSSQEIPRRPQNPRENFENQGQRQGGFNLNFFGFPGLLFGGGLGLGGFTFNLNGFQFGGGQGLPIIYQLFGVDSYQNQQYQQYEGDHYTNRKYQTKTNRNQKSYSHQKSYTNAQHNYEWSYTEYGEIICIIVLTFLIYFIGKIRNRQQQQQGQR